MKSLLYILILFLFAFACNCTKKEPVIDIKYLGPESDAFRNLPQKEQTD